MGRIFIGLALVLTLAFAGVACGGNDEDENGAADIVDTAFAAGSFTTLTSLLEDAGLVETLQGDGPFTVFAPTDEAFDALPEGTLDELSKPENAEQLEQILLYHVAEGEVMSADLSDGQQVTTIQGGTVTVGIDDGGTVTINDATVVQPDVEASNGVIHAIDAVLLPS